MLEILEGADSPPRDGGWLCIDASGGFGRVKLEKLKAFLSTMGVERMATVILPQSDTTTKTAFRVQMDFMNEVLSDENMFYCKMGSVVYEGGDVVRPFINVRRAKVTVKETTRVDQQNAGKQRKVVLYRPHDSKFGSTKLWQKKVIMGGWVCPIPKEGQSSVTSWQPMRKILMKIWMKRLDLRLAAEGS